MRVALLEMLHPEAVPAERPIPPEGAIDEAVETAKAYCGAEAPAFVNGILGAALRELRQNGASAMNDPLDELTTPAGARPPTRLRGGDLDADAAADAGRGVRAPRRARPPPSSTGAPRAAAGGPLPGQGELL